MSYLVYFLFLVIYFGEYVFQKTGLNLKIFAILPEIISVAVGICIVLYFALYRKIKMQPRYLYFYFAFAVHIAIGLIGNQVQPLAILSGIRIYFKFLPFYFLPIIYDISDKQVKGHLVALLFIALLQCPLALYQRFFEYGELYTGDYISGTLTAAPILSIFLVATIAVLIGFYLKKRITVKTFAILVVVVFLPAAINETKAVVILLPLAVLMPTMFGVQKESRVKIIATVIPALILMSLGFHYLYKTMYTGRSDVIAFYTTGQVSDYLYKGREAGRVMGGQESEVGRMDAIVYAYEKNADDLFRLFWGVGIGNAAISFSKKFEGEYTDEYSRLGGKQNALAHLIWEIGLLGIVYILWFLLLIFSDAIRLKNQQEISGPLALGWLGVVIIVLISIPYQNLITKNAILYPFCYLSGFLVASRFLVEREEM